MSEASDRLRRILQEEHRRGYSDSAVQGGLDTFLHHVAPATAADLALRTVLASLPAQGYRALSPEQRQRWAEGVADDRPAAHSPERAGPKRPVGHRVTTTTKRAPTPARRAPLPPRPPLPAGAAALDAPITALPGLRRDMAAKLEGLGAATVRDLLFFFPHRHADYAHTVRIAELRPNEEVTVIASVWSAGETRIGRRMKGAEAVVGDDSGTLRVVWFNQPWIARQLATGQQIVLSGRVTAFRERLVMESPEWEPAEADLTHTGRLVPVYSLTAGLAQRSVRRLVKGAVDTYAGYLSDPLPGAIRKRGRLLPLVDAVRQMHYPDSMDDAGEARRRLAFDELLTIELAVLMRRREWQETSQTPALPLPAAVREGFLASLPFPLTGAQQRAIDEIAADIAQPVPMSRLLEGDVGSGKTVVATMALLAAVANGRQGVIMAPTEILAMQHYRTLTRLFSGTETPALEVFMPPYLGRPLRVGRLIGSMSAKEKARVAEATERGELDIIVGTHALIQDTVRFRDLRLAVVDEQHRFGVAQRAALREKSTGAHLLVMTATPIPRTLALTVYGDLDVSVLDELPPGRLPVKTVRVAPPERDDAYTFVRGQIDARRQAFIICPLVEASDTLQARAATEEFERLRSDVYPDLAERMGLLHGQMPGKTKDAVMRSFAAGELAILISTAVVEVGIDVPNATVMLIEGADRFGLAQLHQFRGRVGRGAERSYCMLLSESPSEEADQRLRLMEETNDGFRLAEADLEMRGPGEYFGTRQSGLPDLKVARLTDVDLIQETRAVAGDLLDGDPNLTKAEHRALNDALVRAWRGREEAPAVVSD